MIRVSSTYSDDEKTHNSHLVIDDIKGRQEVSTI